ncbi:MAG: UDP-2,3-diacylglucosamine diphosphatase [Gammaproteobacteria bacterium]|nr:UDP-2,3-diacylglucosamine diphosphatase [Gammaproteobacteria bacterium]MDH3559919.1 UDP-2,3-diacylglucosamine diphosphatase [Gammaproteobacteria bacterium]
MACTLFISDLHLDPQRPEITRLFLDFLEQRGRSAERLYILGDLFEAWVGDDDDSTLAGAVCTGLGDCARSGTAVYIMHGNRDFLLGKVFTATCGCTLLTDPSAIDLYGQATLLMHGDLLCTDDTEYQAFRAMVRESQWQQAFLAKPLAERRQIAMQLRETSIERTQGKPESIMDVNQQSVVDTMERHAVQRLIHGHTHRPAVHDLTVNGKPAQRLVLGDWYEQGSVLECTPAGCQLQSLGMP